MSKKTGSGEEVGDDEKATEWESGGTLSFLAPQHIATQRSYLAVG